MRYIFLIAGFLIISFTNSPLATEKLNILGLTLDMPLEKLYEKIQPYKESINATSERYINEDDSGGGYLFTLMIGEDEMIVGYVPAPQYDQNPLDIMRIISVPSGDKYLRGDVITSLIEKFGEPTFKNFTVSDLDISKQVDSIFIWGSNHVRGDPACDQDKKYTSTSFLSHCDADMTVFLKESKIIIKLSDPIANQKHEERFRANRKKPRL